MISEKDLLLVESILTIRCGLTRREFCEMNFGEAVKMAEQAIISLREEVSAGS